MSPSRRGAGRTGIALAVVALAAAGACRGADAPVAYDAQPLLPAGSPFHGVHGLRFDEADNLYAASVIGQSIFRVDTATGEVTTFVGPRDGMADDIAIAPDDGMFVWTAIEDGIVHARSADGRQRRLMENQKGVNAVSFSPDGRRLFVSVVFYGDALYELDRTGAAPPRRILENLGGLNAFQVGSDGLIYGPLLFKGQVVSINPDSGALRVISSDFTSPGALKLDFKGSAYVLDGETREVVRLDLRSGRKTVVATMPSGVDNLALDSRGRLFVSLSSLNAIVEVNVETGEQRTVVPPSPLNSPTGLSVRSEGGADVLYVGDLFAGLRTVDARTAAVADTPVDLFQPAHVFASARHLVVVSEVFGTIQLLDRTTFAKVREWTGLQVPGDAIELTDGGIVVAETGSGAVWRLGEKDDGSDRMALVTDLAEPVGLAAAGGVVYVTERRGGRVVRIDPAAKTTAVVARELQAPEGVAIDADGALLVVETGARRIMRIDPGSGTATAVASDLPIGRGYGPSLYRGITVSPSAIYFNADAENTIYRMVRR